MKRKEYSCEVCGYKQAILSKGKCNICRYKERQEKGLIKAPKPLKKTFKKKTSNLGDFFKEELSKLHKRPYSDFSGNYIPNPSVSNVCHILPKRKGGGFPSLATDADNIVFLTEEEHLTFDTHLDRREFNKLEEVFKEYWKQTLIPKIQILLNKATEVNKLSTDLEHYINENK